MASALSDLIPGLEHLVHRQSAGGMVIPVVEVGTSAPREDEQQGVVVQEMSDDGPAITIDVDE